MKWKDSENEENRKRNTRDERKSLDLEEQNQDSEDRGKNTN